MLFFAVFCGSIAEYWLEHKIEHDREKQYIVSLVSDFRLAFFGPTDFIAHYVEEQCVM